MSAGTQGNGETCGEGPARQSRHHGVDDRQTARSLSDELGVPDVEGVAAAVKFIGGLAALGMTNSRRGGYAAPRPKACTGAFARYAPGQRPE